MTSTIPSRSVLFCVLALLTASCNKTNNSTLVNNNSGTGKPSFALNGLSNVIIANNSEYGSTISKELTVEYLDSAQESVALTIAQLPNGIFLDSVAWVSNGIPTFTTIMRLSNPSDTGVKPGNYPIIITATSESGKVRTYPFTLTVQGFPTAFLGEYDSCTTTCTGNVPYTDNVSADPAVRNKIWFSNFRNSGHAVYALLKHNGDLTFPYQIFGNDTLKYGNANMSLSQHSINIQTTINSTYCPIQFRKAL